MSFALELNPALRSLPVYQPGRPIDEVARDLGLNPGEIIKLASNENPLGPSPAALAAMQRILPHLHLYPDGNAFHLKRKLAAKFRIEPSNLILGNGSNEIIEFVGHALMAPGVDVIVSQYCFAVYPIVIHLFAANLVSVPARDYGHNLRAMLQAITPRTRVMFVGNPNNPTGTVASKDELFQLVDAIPPHVLLVLDEAYVEFLDESADLLAVIRSGSKPNLLLMRTFSKIFGLAGLRLGYGIGHPELIAALEKIRQPFNCNALVQAAAFAALDDAEHLTRTRDNNTAGLRLLEHAFQKLKLPFVPSAANFVLVRVGDGDRVFHALQKREVIVRPMASYGLPEWIRITVGTPQQNAKCLTELESVLAATT